MSTFSVMKENVGNNVRDTSNPMAAIIGTYLNNRYFQILRRVNWSYVNEDYTVNTVAGTQDYALESDFNKELYVKNNTDNNIVDKYTLENLVADFSTELTTQGQVKRYAIFNSDDGSKYIRFHYVPDKVCEIAVPYIAKPSALSGDSDEPVIDLSFAMELGATADAFRYKKQFKKASDFEVLFEREVANYIWDDYNQPNKVYQFTPTTFNRDNLI